MRKSVKSYSRLWWLYGCLTEPQGVSAWWKETARTCVSMLSSSFLLNHREPQSSNVKLLLPIIPIRIVGYAFILLWGNLVETAVCCIVIDNVPNWLVSSEKRVLPSLYIECTNSPTAKETSEIQSKKSYPIKWHSSTEIWPCSGTWLVVS